MELGSQNHRRDGPLGPNSIVVVYMDPLGLGCFAPCVETLSEGPYGSFRQLGVPYFGVLIIGIPLLRVLC